MKLTRGLVSLSLIFSLSFISFLAIPVHTVTAQDSTITLQRGYRTGYSDGYMAGYRDVIDNAEKSFAKHGEYSDAKRAYSKDYGSLEDYRDGYQQGFEAGYETGFEKRSFDGTVPEGLQRRGVRSGIAETQPAAGESETNAATDTKAAAAGPPEKDTTQLVSFRPVSDATIIIPRDTELIVELLEDLNTDRNREGDKFTARIVSPTEITGGIIEGRISKIDKPGRIKKRSQMLLSFDRIVLTETRWSNFNAITTEVLPMKGDNVKRVDTEGTAVGKSTWKPDSIKVGAATGSGIVIGAIAGGPVGAAVGAGIGAAAGVGAVLIERGKHIKLTRGQQIRIKSSYETQIR